MRRNTYRRRKSRRATKRKQRRIFSRKPRKMRGGGIPNKNIVGGIPSGAVVTVDEVDTDGYANAPVMESYSEYKKQVQEV